MTIQVVTWVTAERNKVRMKKKKSEKRLAWWVIMNQHDQLLEKGIGTRHPIVQAKRTHLES
jgi:hypothetical protein